MVSLQWSCMGEMVELRRKRCQPVYATDKQYSNLVLIYSDGSFYAMDSVCSHMGGPLHFGDIEDFNGRPHVMCPWHGYMFDIQTGKNVLGMQQETYKVKIEDFKVYVEHACKLQLEQII